jgi:transcriptional regulator with XRE-family HTH domain
MDNLNIGHKIKKLRELRNLTQEHMASSLGLSQSAYSRLELGETEITFSKLEKISEELGMKPEEIIAFNESMVFNVMNNQTGNGLVINNNVPREETKESKNLYEQLIDQLKEENAHLKKIIENLLKS